MIPRHQLEKPYENDERYQEINKQIGVVRTVGQRGVIVLGEYKPLDHLRNELNSFIQKEIANPSEREKNLGRYMQTLNELKDMARQ